RAHTCGSPEPLVAFGSCRQQRDHALAARIRSRAESLLSEPWRTRGGRQPAPAHQGRARLARARGRAPGRGDAAMIEVPGMAAAAQESALAQLLARRLRIHTVHESVVFLRSDSRVCRAAGLGTQVRVTVRFGAREIMATLYQVDGDALGLDEAGLSESAWKRLGLQDGDTVSIRQPHPLDSHSALRRRIFGHRLDETSLCMVISDIAAERYSDVHIGSFLTACTTLPLDADETRALTRAMVGTGVQLSWPAEMVLDKHCVGGLPGNRTTPLVVAIVAAHGLTIPKTSSRAITS